MKRFLIVLLTLIPCLLLAQGLGSGFQGRGGLQNAADSLRGITTPIVYTDTLTTRAGGTSVIVPVTLVVSSTLETTKLRAVSTTTPQLELTHTLGADSATVSVDGNGLLTVTTVDGGGAAGHVVFLPDGNVGVGTSAPDGVLEVNMGTSGEVRLSYNDADGSATDYAKFEIADDGLLTITTVDADAAEADIALMPDGNVGIGTAAPGALFHVDPELGGDADNDSAFVVTVRGHAGIGTATPGAVNLLVLGIGGTEIQAKAEGTTSSSIVKARNSDGEQVQFISNGSAVAGTRAGINRADLAEIFSNQTAGLLIDSESNSMMAFATNATERMRILAGGNIGIGTTTPSEMLHLDGAGGTDGTGTWTTNASVSTTDATLTTLYTLATTTDRAYRVKLDYIGAQDDGSNSMGALHAFTFKNVAGTVTEQGDVSIQETDDSAGIALSGAVSGTNYLIQVTAIAAENWNHEGRITATVVAH
jgi:hypothetical protein